MSESGRNPAPTTPRPPTPPSVPEREITVTVRTKAKKKPTPESIERAITKLLRDTAHVHKSGAHTSEKTNEHGTIVVTWKSGGAVLKEKA